MKLETRLRLESNFDTVLLSYLVKIENAQDIDSSTLRRKELITYIRLQVNTAYKLGVQAGAGTLTSTQKVKKELGL